MREKVKKKVCEIRDPSVESGDGFGEVVTRHFADISIGYVSKWKAENASAGRVLTNTSHNYSSSRVRLMLFDNLRLL